MVVHVLVDVPSSERKAELEGQARSLMLQHGDDIQAQRCSHGSPPCGAEVEMVFVHPTAVPNRLSVRALCGAHGAELAEKLRELPGHVEHEARR